MRNGGLTGRLHKRRSMHCTKFLLKLYQHVKPTRLETHVHPPSSPSNSPHARKAMLNKTEGGSARESAYPSAASLNGVPKRSTLPRFTCLSAWRSCSIARRIRARDAR